MKRGRFIVFEGIDGSGKSTYIDLLARELEKQGLTVYRTREQTDGRIGRLIREYAESGDRYLEPETEALLFAADRTEHQKEIEDALDDGWIVVSDRYIHSSLAYQGAAGVDLDWIRKINFKAKDPDLVILLDIDPGVSLDRVRWRSMTVFEGREYLERVRGIYLQLASRGEMVVVDGGRERDEVYRDVKRHVDRLLARLLK